VAGMEDTEAGRAVGATHTDETAMKEIAAVYGGKLETLTINKCYRRLSIAVINTGSPKSRETFGVIIPAL